MKIRTLFALAFATALAAPLQAQHTNRHPAPLSLIAGPMEYRPQAFDVLHYDAWLDLTAAPARTTSGTCEIRMRWTGDPDTSFFYFHLRSLRVDSIFYNGVPTTATADGTPDSEMFHYAVKPPASAGMGDTALVRIVYSGEMTNEGGARPWGGVSSMSGSLFAMGVGFSNNYVSATQHWLPCYDHPSDKATFRGRFRARNGKSVASNGVVTVTPETDSTMIYDWRHDIPCATYLLTFAIDNYVPLDIHGAGPPMVIYSKPADTAATRTTFKLLPQMVSGFETRFGPYPFEKVGYVNTPIGAMEHQTMISFPTSLSRSRDTVNSTGAHELAHQWFGDLVSPLDFRHAWLNESFATFCESVWEEELGGYAAYLKSQEGKVNQYINSIAPSEGIFPLYDFPRQSPSSNYPATIYEKGAVVVGMLRYELGDSIFYTTMKEYLRTYAYGVATTDQLQAIAEAQAGRSLAWFFDQWVLRKGWPVLTVRTSKSSTGPGMNRVSVDLEQIQADSIQTFVNLPVELGFRAANGATVYRMVRMNSRSQAALLDSIPDFTTVTVNRGPSVRALLRATTLSGVETVNAGADSDAIEFTVKPNPMTSASIFTVDVNGTSECSGVQYELYDSAGRRLLLGRTDSCEFPIPTSGFNSGVYVLRFKFRDLYHDVPVMITR